MKGSASIAQIGEAAAMRSWVDEKTFRELSKIVHSADKNPYDRTGPNKYADNKLVYDEKAQAVINSVVQEYRQNKRNYYENEIDNAREANLKLRAELDMPPLPPTRPVQSRLTATAAAFVPKSRIESSNIVPSNTDIKPSWPVVRKLTPPPPPTTGIPSTWWVGTK